MTIWVKEQCLRNSINDALRIFREGHIDSGSALDLADFTQEYIEYDAINRIVCSVKKTGFDDGRHLTEAINTPLALFQTVWIPGQVIVQNPGKLILQVYTFREAVRCNKHTLRRLTHFFNVLFT